MQVFIRTDASIQIGSGHVMRCLTLAKQLQQKNVHVKFICRNIEGNLIEFIVQQGFEVCSLPKINTSLHWDWTKENWKKDAKETIEFIQDEYRVTDLLVVDHYSISSEWEKELRPLVKKIMVIDDLANREHDCDILLDQNYHSNIDIRYQNLVPKNCVQLLGPNYVLLRDEFFKVQHNIRKRKEKIENIIVFFGGTDPTGETIKVLAAINKLNIPEIEINVVVGGANPKSNEIEQICNEMINVTFHNQVNNMAELMQKADLAIGAGGTTTWERCFMNLPSITVIIAENQRELTESLSEKGISLNLGPSTEVGIQDIKNSITSILQEPALLRDMSTSCSQVMDPFIIKKNPVLQEIMEVCL